MLPYPEAVDVLEGAIENGFSTEIVHVLESNKPRELLAMLDHVFKEKINKCTNGREITIEDLNNLWAVSILTVQKTLDLKEGRKL